MDTPERPILIVEDIANVRDMLEITLRFKGYPVVTASNGLEALERIKEHHPILVVTDLLMPKMDGYTLVHTIRRSPETNRTPIIIISATYVSPEDKNFALSLGAVRFLEKPIDTEDFLLTVAEVLTQGYTESPNPIGEIEFFQRYRDTLENKLRYKNAQIARIERLLQSLPTDQKPAFEAFLSQSVTDREEIKAELDQLYDTLQELNKRVNSNNH